MIPHNQVPLIAITSLRSTIETDSQVFRWFLYLITHPTVKSELSVDKCTEEIYERLKRWIGGERILCLSILGLIIYIYFSKQYLLCYLAILWFGLYLIVHQKIKKYVTQISLSLISKDFKSAEFNKRTLYQIGEFYGHKYQIKSLVMAITSTENILRKVAIAAWFFLIFIFPVNFFGFLAILTLTIYVITPAVIHLSVIYNRLK